MIIRARRAALALLIGVTAPVAWSATINVTGNTFDDELNSDGDCSLREAVRSANSDSSVDNCTAGDGGIDEIVLPRGTYTLSLSGTEAGDGSERDLDVTSTTLIRPRSGNATSVRLEPADGYTGRAFEVGGSGTTLTLQKFTIHGFDAGSGASGGAVNNQGQTLVLEEMVLDANEGNASGAIGASGFPTVVIENSTLSDNVATSGSFGLGGAVGSNVRELTLTDVTLIRNHSEGDAGGIGTDGTNQLLNMDNVTLVNNTAAGDGGGFHLGADTDVNIRNTIISGNRVGGEGAECAQADGLTLTGSRDFNLWSKGGSCFGSLGNNSIESSDAGLGLAGFYDGSTESLPPLDGSPAIDAGSCQNLAGTNISADKDQRQSTATRNADGDGDGTQACDIGAIERQRTAIEVDAVADTDDALLGDGSCADSDGRCTLRAAIDETNATPGLDVIHLGSEDYVLTKVGNDEDGNATGDLDIRDSVILIGKGAADTIIESNGLDRALHVPSEGSDQERTLGLHSLAVKSGDNVANDGAPSGKKAGGGVHIRGKSNEPNQLVADSVHFYGNRAGDATNDSNIDGGGISVTNGTLRLVRSTLSSNEAERSGSGIYLGGGSRGWIQSTTVSGNIAGNGDAVSVGGGFEVHLERVTIASNEGFSTAVGSGGRITAHNSIIGVGGNNPCDFFSGDGLVSLGHNLDETGDCALSKSSDQSNAVAGLAELTDLGASVPLRAPEGTSYAVDTGSCVAATGYILPRSPLGGTRPQDAGGFGNGLGDGNYDCDVGAAERQSIAVSAGANMPGERAIDLPSGEVVVAQFTLANEAGEPLNGRVVTLSTSGTGDESADITAANLYIDTNGDGALDDNDTLVDSVTPVADDGEIRFEFSGSESAVPGGGELQLIVTYSFSDSLAATTTEAVQYANPALLSAFVLVAFAPLRRARCVLLIAFVALSGCSGGGSDGGDEETDDSTLVEEAESRTYSLALESLSVEGSSGGKLRIRAESVPSNTLTVTDQ